MLPRRGGASQRFSAMPRRKTAEMFPDADDAPRADGDADGATDTAAPLAERMRPRTLAEFVGQQQLVGEGRVLRRIIEGRGALPSLIFWGAPGTGKTTLARLLARHIDADFVALSAVFSGVKAAP